MAKLLEAVDNGDSYRMTSFADDGLWRAYNKCGHTILHRALLSDRRHIIEQIVQAYPRLCHVADNVRTGLLKTV